MLSFAALSKKQKKRERERKEKEKGKKKKKKEKRNKEKKYFYIQYNTIFLLCTLVKHFATDTECVISK